MPESAEALLGLTDRATECVATRAHPWWTGEIPAVTMTQTAYYCAAVGVRDPIHYDHEFARSVGFDGAVVNGSLRQAWLCYLAEAMGGNRWQVDSVRCEHRGLLAVGAQIAVTVGWAGGSVREPDGGLAGSDSLELSVVLRSEDRVVDSGLIHFLPRET